ncbi:unnamed protein product [Rhizophagus irregularis]|nr:unnamed protein product [Rhizophagus irregularis]
MYLDLNYQYPAPSPVVHIRKNHLSIENLANWLANPEVKNNPSVISKKVSKIDAEWFNLMEKSPSRFQKKSQVSQLEEDSEASSTQVHREGNEDAERWDQKQHESGEIRLLTSAELKDQLGIKKKAYKEKLTFTP